MVDPQQLEERITLLLESISDVEIIDSETSVEKGEYRVKFEYHSISYFLVLNTNYEGKGSALRFGSSNTLDIPSEEIAKRLTELLGLDNSEKGAYNSYVWRNFKEGKLPTVNENCYLDLILFYNALKEKADGPFNLDTRFNVNTIYSVFNSLGILKRDYEFTLRTACSRKLLVEHKHGIGIGKERLSTFEDYKEPKMAALQS